MSCSLYAQNDLSGSIYWSLTVWLLYPRTHIGALASCTTYHLFYVRLSKNSFRIAHQVSSWKRMQRYNFFPNHQNFSKKNFNLNRKNIRNLICVKSRNTIYLIIYNARTKDYLLSSGAWPISSMNSSSFGVMIIWVRRLRCLPTSVVLGWRGLYSPRPPAVKRLGSTP